MSWHFDLETAVAAWRRPFERDRAFSVEDVEELETGLRDRVEALVGAGWAEEAAFREALRRMGSYGAAEAEYRKVYWGKLRRRPHLRDELIWGVSMLTNYFKTAVRALVRHRGYSAINIAGLTLGLASCLLIFQYVAFEFSFDRFHEHEPDLYRVLQATPLVGESTADPMPFTSFALGPALVEEVPEVQNAARIHPEYGVAVVTNPEHPGRVFEETEVFYVDPAFQEVFTFPLVGGGETGPASGTLLLSESAARKYFGDADPIGRALDWKGQVAGLYRVAGVFRDVPPNSHMQFDFLLPIDDLLRAGYANEAEQGWNRNNFYTYVRLVPGADTAAVGRKITALYQARRGEVLRTQGRTARMAAQPLRDIHLNDEVEGPGFFVTSSYRTVYFFTLVGIITLLIALVNYVNLATARAVDRAREVGVRKVVGAHRRQLVVQFLCESALTNGVAAVCAVGLAVLLAPVVSDLAATPFPRAGWMNPWFWAACIATFGACTVLAGWYPGFVLSAFRPVAVLKGRAGPLAAQLWLRRGLVVVQFAASVVLVAGTAVVYDQLDYMRGLELGLDLEQVLTVRGPRVLPEGADGTTVMTTFVRELEQIPGVQQVARSASLPGQGFNWYGASFRRAQDDPAATLTGVVTYIDTSFASLYGLELAAGTPFTDATPSEGEEAVWPVMTTETAVRALGFASAAEAVGEALEIGARTARILGVYRDFHWSSAHEAREHIFFGYTGAGRQVSLRVRTDDLPGTIAAVERIHARLFPGNVFQYAFADETFDRQYRADERFATLFALFAGIAIAIACLGLFGLTAFTTRQRTKEIGVRKVLGASVAGLVALLSRDLLKLVGLAFVIAVPPAFFLMQRWLDGFAYHIALGPRVFLLAGGLAFLLAFATVALQAVRAARAHPVDSLRYE